MNPKIWIVALVFILGCSKSDDPSNQPTAKAVATIAGKAFNATDVTATDTGNGLEIKMTGGNQTISLVTNATTSGTYNIINTTSGRMQASGTAYGVYSNGTDVYNFKTGTVTISINGDKTSVEFSVNASNSSGNSVTIGGGKIPSLTIKAAQVPSGKCLISDRNNGNVYTYVYDNEGKLLKILLDNTDFDLFLWVNGVVTTHFFYAGPNTIQMEDWFYTNGNLSSIVIATMKDSLGTTYTTSTSREYVLSAAGKPEQIVFKDGNGKVNGTQTYAYDTNGNCTSYNYADHVTTYSNYDNHTNRHTYIANALGLTFDPLGFEGETFSNNNVGKVEYTLLPETDFLRYTYDAQGKVTQIADSVIYNGVLGSVYSATIGYKCN